MQDVMDRVGTTVAAWWWIVALVVLFALVYRFGKGSSTGASQGAGYGCLVAVAITLVFFLVVVF